MNETYLAWLVLGLFVALGALSLKADVFKIESGLLAITVFLWQVLFGGALAIAVVFAVIWALVTVAS
jgi:hypothetical protein